MLRSASPCHVTLCGMCPGRSRCIAVSFNAVLYVRDLHAQAGVPEAGARWLFQQILVAVDFCHRLGIALRDIKVRAAAAALLCMPALAHPSSCDVGSVVSTKPLRDHPFAGHSAIWHSLTHCANVLDDSGVARDSQWTQLPPLTQPCAPPRAAGQRADRPSRRRAAHR